MAGGIVSVSALVSISNDTSLISPIVEEETVLQTLSLKGLAQAKILKKSVILFRVLNMTI